MRFHQLLHHALHQSGLRWPPTSPKTPPSAPPSTTTPHTSVLRHARSTLPSSLDAALTGTLTSEPKIAAGATISESMLKSWYFDIYEDTPGEEAVNLMEHSLTRLMRVMNEFLDTQKERGGNRGDENRKGRSSGVAWWALVVAG
ncbi:hypothetical protein PRZ48_005260 [Zasmidium cellare]|uniref:Uncharacterized protein n=1 Tax=Zasmidium cellare TaxID=395010 RepID=A0ABR0ESI4_ZASCE|nr:hypothetical protein PRZ48_005260 [Zasmidium cellare]